MTLTKHDIEKAKDFLTEDAKSAFLDMTENERMIVLLSIEGSNSNRLAVVERRQIDTERDNRIYRQQREIKEKNGENHKDENDMNTTQKIIRMIEEERAKQFNYAVWFRDRVLPQVITLVTLAVLYLTFGGKLP